MYLVLRLFNSIIFVIANLSIALYTLQRFFRVMKAHYQLVDEVEQYSNLVDESRASLNYVGQKVMEAMKEMEVDIGKEVCVTHNLTKLSGQIASTSKRFHELEERIIELARLNYNVENATVETPPDINQEVRQILGALKRKTASTGETPRSPVQRSTKSSRSHGTIESNPAQPAAPSPISKFSAVQAARQNSPRSRSPNLVPDVMLLNEQSSCPVEKSIGFRPPWMCQV